jgi:MATE family multidrug resistance protein
MTRIPPGGSKPGGTAELLRLAWPLILSNSFWTLQLLLDRVLLSRFSPEAVGAGMAAALLYWTPINLLQSTASYATTFVAQYTGAGQHRRVGPVVWQALHFSLAAGILFMGLAPLAGPLVALGGHSARLQELEATYLSCLAFSGLPLLVTAAASSFFAGRGDSRTVLGINAVGLAVNGLLALLLIFGRPELGVPSLGIAGAGWATVAGSSASAALSVALLLRPRYRAEYATGSGWRPDPALFARLMRFSLPNGLFVALDTLGFALFVQLVGRLGEAALSATSVTFALNLVAILPTLGIGQAVEVLVGQRLGEDRPDVAARSTWAGFRVALGFTALLALAYVLLPGPLIDLFEGRGGGPEREAVRALVPVLLRFVAVYCLFDTMNVVFSFALRGAGDTRYVTVRALDLSAQVLVIPTWLAVRGSGGLYAAWAFASLYVIVLGLTFLARFLQGQWRTMRVIEAAPPAGAEVRVAAAPLPALHVAPESGGDVG